MRILILTQYFPPEVGAPQNRLYELAVRMQRLGADVTILTAMPNYPEMKVHERYRRKLYKYEEMDGLKVHRSWIFVSKSGSIIPRLLNYFSFVFTSFFTGWFKLRKQDYIICESPPLFLGLSARGLCRVVGGKLIFNVSDLWPESVEKLGVVRNQKVLAIARRLEEHLYKRSVAVTGQTQGIVNNIQGRFPHKRTYWLPNGVDLTYYDPARVNSSGWRQANGFDAGDFILLYAGILGHAQGLEVVLRAAKRITDPRIRMVIMGSGPEKDKLLAMKQELGVQQVHFLDQISKSEMPGVLKECDATLVPLKKLDLFLGAIPSKIFEGLAMNCPVVLGVDGEARNLFIDQGKCGLYFEPENEEELAARVSELAGDVTLHQRLSENAASYVAQRFDRDAIASDFMAFVRELP